MACQKKNFNPPKPSYLKGDLSVKARQQTTLLFSLTTGTETIADLKLVFTPVTFEIFGVDDAGVMAGERGPNRKPHELNMRTKMNEEEHYDGYTKCVPIIWTGGALDLSKYLALYAKSKDLFTDPDLFTWTVTQTGEEPAPLPGFMLGLGNSPSADNVTEFRIEVFFTKGNLLADRLILAVIPPATEAAFTNWVEGEGAPPLQWWDELPIPYASLGPDNSDPESQDLECELWEDLESLNNFYHPGASFELRSAATVGAHSHQACYGDTGTIIKSGISAGTVDSVKPTIWSAADHLDEDVKPFIWAAQLDGNPVRGVAVRLVPFRYLSQPILHQGALLQRYLTLRPPRTAQLREDLGCLLEVPPPE